MTTRVGDLVQANYSESFVRFHLMTMPPLKYDHDGQVRVPEGRPALRVRKNENQEGPLWNRADLGVILTVVQCSAWQWVRILLPDGSTGWTGEWNVKTIQNVA